MINISELTEAHVGRRVVYNTFAGREQGLISSWNDVAIFVRYARPQGDMSVDPRWNPTAAATDPQDLEFAPEPEPQQLELGAEEQPAAEGEPQTERPTVDTETGEMPAQKPEEYTQPTLVDAPRWWDIPGDEVIFEERQVGGKLVVMVDLRGPKKGDRSPIITTFQPAAMFPNNAELLKGMLDRAVKASKAFSGD